MPFETLKVRADFLRVRKGRKYATPSLVLQAALIQDAKRGRGGGAGHASRFGFTVTKQVGSAVIRNRVRRRLREAVRSLGPLHARPGYDYVLIGRRGTLKRGFTDILGDLRLAFQSVHRSNRAPKMPQ